MVKIIYDIASIIYGLMAVPDCEIEMNKEEFGVFNIPPVPDCENKMYKEEFVLFTIPDF